MDSPARQNSSDQARQRDRDALMRLRRREWVGLAIALAIVLIGYANVKRVEVSGISMEPTFYGGDTLFVWKTVPVSSLRAGDIIVFRSPDGDELIKRIIYIARPGTPAQYPPPGFPRIVRQPDGVPLDDENSFEPYFSSVTDDRIPAPPRANTIYVMGDNAMHSSDSRDFGPISPSQLLGKVIMK